MKYSSPDKGGDKEESKYINMAKDVLADKERREDYNNALINYGLLDGLKKDRNFENNLKKRAGEIR